MLQKGPEKMSLQLRIEVNTAKKEGINVEQDDMADGEIPSIPFNSNPRALLQPLTPYPNQAVGVLDLVDSSYAELQAAMSAKNKNSDKPRIITQNLKRGMECEGKKEKEINSAGAKTSSTGVGSVASFLPPGGKKPPTASEVDDDETMIGKRSHKKAKKINSTNDAPGLSG